LQSSRVQGNDLRIKVRFSWSARRGCGEQAASWGLLVIAVGVSLLLAWHIRSFVIDDAFITIRYATHLAGGHGIVWNVGERPLEGFTGFLQMLLVAGAVKLGLDPMVFVKGLGLLMLVSTLVFMFYAGGRLCTLLAGGAGALLVAATPMSIIHASSGLETASFAFGVMALATVAMLHLEKPTSIGRWGICIGGFVLGLVRPEGVLVSAILLAAIWLTGRHSETLLSWIAPVLLGILIPGLVYMGWRSTYFGDLLPNTFYVKGPSASIDTGRLYDYLTSDWASFLTEPSVLLVSTLMLLSLLVPEPSVAAIPRQYASFLLLPGVGLAVGYAQTPLTMNFSHRFFFPIYLLLTLASLPMLDWIGRRFVGLRPWEKVLVLIVSFCFLGSVWLPEAKKDLDWARRYGKAIDNCWLIGETIYRAVGDDNGITIVSSDAGAIPYYSRQKAIDPLGLNDRYLARRGSLDTDYIYGLAPDLLVLTSYEADRIVHPSVSEPLARHEKFGQYETVARFRHDRDYYKLICVRKGSPRYTQLKARLGRISELPAVSKTLPIGERQ
jgi:hypothetical protein